MLNYQSTQDFALEQDRIDELASFRNQFHFPKDKNGENCIYMTGNSLGLQPKRTKDYINGVLEDWANLAVEGHFNGDNPWYNYQEDMVQSMAKIVGAKPDEVVIMNTLTVNLHFLMASFYKPTKNRFKILIEADAFPSDKYAVESQLRHHGFDHKEGLILWESQKNLELLNIEDLETILASQGHEIALILIGAVNYYTGQFYNLKRITELGHQYGCIVGFDCAHGAGNIPLNLHYTGADFASWCTYKYLNSGPGSIAACFVHERHAHKTNLNRFSGWWGHNKTKRFRMRDEFEQIPGAAGWQVSNPPILSLAGIKGSLEIFNQVSIEKLRNKSKQLTGYLEFLLKELGEDKIRIITPSNANERGCQLSIYVKNADKNLHNKFTDSGVISDWREPNVIRCAPTPLYNSFNDVYNLVERLKAILND